MTAFDGSRFSRRDLVAAVAAVRRAPSETDVISYLLGLEVLAVALYGLALDSGVLTDRAGGLVGALRRQERAHAGALLRWLWGPQSDPVSAIAELSPGETQTALIAAGIKIELPKLRTQNDWFWMLVRLEEGLEGGYIVALSELHSRRAVSLAATILASEAQHATVLAYQRNPLNPYQAVPAGLVQGSPPAREPRPVQPAGA